MKRRNILHTGMAAMLLLSVSACEDFKFGNDFLDKPLQPMSLSTPYFHAKYMPNKR